MSFRICEKEESEEQGITIRHVDIMKKAKGRGGHNSNPISTFQLDIVANGSFSCAITLGVDGLLA